MDVITKKLTVRGMVQMVGFRWYAKQKADQCHVRGYVRNTSRGDVEIVTQGSEGDILTYIDYLKIGPSRARVTAVQQETLPNDRIYNEFNIRM